MDAQEASKIWQAMGGYY
nr:hypothetical protein [uncultured Lactobacillus sp.]